MLRFCQLSNNITTEFSMANAETKSPTLQKYLQIGILIGFFMTLIFVISGVRGFYMNGKLVKPLFVRPVPSEVVMPISQYADSQFFAACDGESRPERQCRTGYNQACVPKVACKCADGWEVNAGPVDGCVKWSGGYIPGDVEGYSFAGECAQVCRLSGRAQ
jgi:hypothetical protein